jgi:hypothetical protein
MKLARGRDPVELANAAYLYTLALIAIGYVGFTAIVLILRQSLGGTLSSLDALVARLFMVRGFVITYLSMAPMLLASFELSHTTVWQVASALGGLSLVVTHVGYQVLRGRITGDPTPLHLWFYTVSGSTFGVVLLANASAVAPSAIAAIYVTGVTLDMIQASIAFVHHFGFMIQEMQTQRKNVG